ncbi:MAG: galactokinase [Atopostipes sp.]|nr:galactokinase [Atopostipes sp.]
MIEELNQEFQKIYNQKSDLAFFAPGRINLIGEHIDYNGGHVFPCAITFGTYASVKEREDRKVRLYSKNFEELGSYEFDLDHLVYDEKDEWTNYVKGVLAIMQKDGHKLTRGFDVAYEGNIPNGAGLSSSASLEVVSAVIADYVNDLNLSKMEIVKIALRAENDFVGVQCGIMDQFAVTMGKKNQAMLLDTRTNDFDYAPLDLKDNVIVIMNTNKQRGLSDSAYNERREQCDQALEILNTVKEEDFLCDHDLATLNENKNLFEDELVYQRARHAITENLRTNKAAEVLEEDDLEKFGQLMNESHKSLRDDYDVTGKELDTIVAAAQKQEGVYGARVTGAGFGGSAIAIVNKDQVDSFIEAVGSKYEKEIGYAADFYIASPGKGAGKIE